MKVTIDSMLRVTEASPEIIKKIKQDLTIKNPEYQKKRAMGLPLWGCSKEIKLWEEKEGTLILPRGFARKLWLIEKFECDEKRLTLPEINYSSSIQLRDYQEPAIEVIKKAKQGVVNMPCGAGKGHPLSTKVYTPTGYTTIGTLKEGDKIIGSDGKSISVTGIFDRGVLPTYKVNFSDETSLLCDEDHFWKVQSQCQRTDNTNNWYIKNVRELMAQKLHCGLEQKHNRSKWYIPMTKPVQFENKTINIDPYFLGVWLGDGCSKNGHLHITNAEKDIIERLKISVELSQYEYNEFGVIKAKQIEEEFEYLGLMGKESHEKFIPDIFKYNSIQVRLSILQGLMDSDGSVDKAMFSITSTSETMMRDLLEIIQSLGGTGKIAERQTFFTNYGHKKPGMKSYRLHFKLVEFMPFLSEKHSAKYSPRTKYKQIYRNIKSIEFAGEMPIRCISVDAEDKLYVAENFIVTHNTETGLAILASLKQPALWLTHTKDLLNQSLERAKARLNLQSGEYGIIAADEMSIGTHITFGMIQTMANRDLSELVNKFGAIVIDECHHVYKNSNSVAQFYSVISQFPAKHRIGLTATAHRADGLIDTMFQTIGPIIYQVQQETLNAAGNVVTPTVELINTDFEFDDEEPDPNKRFRIMLNQMQIDYKRNAIITAVLKINSHHFNLVLGDGLEHLESLMLNMGGNAVFICGKTPKKEREKLMGLVRAGKYKYLFCTYQLAKEGLDIPHLDRLYLITPKRDKTSIQQAVGRIMRKAEGKIDAIVYDFLDVKIGTCKAQGAERRKVYKALGCQINKPEGK